MRGFGTDEGGAISADWLALSAALVALSLALAAQMGTGVESLGETTGAALQGAQVSALGTLGYAE